MELTQLLHHLQALWLAPAVKYGTVAMLPTAKRATKLQDCSMLLCMQLSLPRADVDQLADQFTCRWPLCSMAAGSRPSQFHRYWSASRWEYADSGCCQAGTTRWGWPMHLRRCPVERNVGCYACYGRTAYAPAVCSSACRWIHQPPRPRMHTERSCTAPGKLPRLLTVIQCLQELLDTPNCDSPAHTPAYHSYTKQRAAYTQLIRKQAARYPPSD